MARGQALRLLAVLIATALMWTGTSITPRLEAAGLAAAAPVGQVGVVPAVAERVDLAAADPFASSSRVGAATVDSLWGWGARQHLLDDGTAPRTTPQLLPTRLGNTGPINETQITDIDASSHFACLLADGEPYCWGDGPAGELGNGAVGYSPVPVRVETNGVLAGRTITDIDTGDSFACVLADGLPFCWGWGMYGALGTTVGSPYYSAVPVAVDLSAAGLDGDRVTEISLGGDFGCLLADNKPFCWGDNGFGAGGEANGYHSDFAPVPVDVHGVLDGMKLKDLSANQRSVCVLADGHPYCWGYNAGSFGNQLDAGSATPVPTYTDGFLARKTITDLQGGGGGHMCALADGKAYCWGANGTGQLGFGEPLGIRYEPVPVISDGALAGRSIQAIELGHTHTCALADGDVFCWGSAFDGEVGNNTGRYTSVPVQITTAATFPQGTTPKSLALGFAVTLLVTQSEVSPPASAPRNPFGSFDLGTLAGNAYTVQGWAIDPDTPRSATFVDFWDHRPDGTWAATRVSANTRRDDVGRAFPTEGPMHGFRSTLNLSGAGVHEVCAYAIDTTSPDQHTLLGCTSVSISPPIGALDSAYMPSVGQLALSGWATAPSAPAAALTIDIYDGAQRLGRTTTTAARPDVPGVFPWARPDTGFQTEVSINGAGPHQICAVATDPTTNVAQSVGCRTINVQDAFGALDSVTTADGTIRVLGWAINPNRPTQPVEIHVYDFGPTTTTGTPGLFTGSPRPDVAAAFPGSGSSQGYDVTVHPNTPGDHTICAFAITTGGGSGNTLIGCETVTIR